MSESLQKNNGRTKAYPACSTPQSLANLRPVQKGQRPKCNGRPKGSKNKKTLVKLALPKTYSNTVKAHQILVEQQEIADGLRAAVKVRNKLVFTSENLAFAQTLIGAYAKMIIAVETIARLDGSLKDETIHKNLQDKEDHDGIYNQAIAVLSRRKLPDEVFANMINALYFEKFQMVPPVNVMEYFKTRFEADQMRWDVIEVKELTG